MKKTVKTTISLIMAACFAGCLAGCGTTPTPPEPPAPPAPPVIENQKTLSLSVNGEVVYTTQFSSEFTITRDLLDEPILEGYQPVYFKNGVPYSFPKTVNSNTKISLLQGWEKQNQSGEIQIAQPSPVQTATAEHVAFWQENDMSRASLYEDYNLTGKAERSRPQAISLNWTPTQDVVSARKNYRVTLSEDPTFSTEYQVIETSKSSSATTLEVDNLKINSIYYAKVQALNSDGDVVLDGAGEAVACFATADAPVRTLRIPGATNARDIGAYKTLDGHRLNQNVVLRTGRLNTGNATTCSQTISLEAVDFLVNSIGIKTEIELRGKRDGTDTGKPYSYECGNPNGISVLNNNSTGKHVNWVYAGMNDSYFGAYAEIRTVFETLGNAENYPLLYHCAIGTDRTGMISFYILALCNVGADVIQKDYMFSNFGNIGNTRSVSALNTYFNLVNARPGNKFCEKTEDYLVNVVGVQSEHIRVMREMLLGEEYAATLA